jgi:adenylylsulfate kinase
LTSKLEAKEVISTITLLGLFCIHERRWSMVQTNPKNITWHQGQICREDREQLLQQKGKVLWFTGLSGSGKSTIANHLAQKLHAEGKLTYVLDGDNIRFGLNKDLGFSQTDRQENIRRIGEVAKLFVDAGIVTLAAFISPLKEDRENLRVRLGEDLIEIFVECPLEVCEARDPKKLYAKARRGEIKEFTGITSPYERPDNPELVIKTEAETVEQAVNKILEYLITQNLQGRVG